MKSLSRRSVMTGLAAAVTAVPAVALSAGGVDKSKLSPDQRIEAAIAEIEAAMREKHPSWRCK
jgi:hypothetical protein